MRVQARRALIVDSAIGLIARRDQLDRLVLRLGPRGIQPTPDSPDPGDTDHPAE